MILVVHVIEQSSLRLSTYDVLYPFLQELFLCGNCQSYREENAGLLDPRS
jgi:hypothetical protein